MKVIFNGDDFGYTKGITDGIIHACKHGIIRSTTALVNGEDIERAAEKAKNIPELHVGLHLNLTLGKALIQNQTLSHPDGTFYSKKELESHIQDPEEIYAEWKAQMNRFIELFGKAPTHLDSHHGMHDCRDHLPVTMKLAEEYDLPVRRYSDYQYVPDFFAANEPAQLIEILQKYAGQNLEIMCHAGFVDDRLRELSSVTDSRERELAVLCSQEVYEYMKENGVESTWYKPEDARIHE